MTTATTIPVRLQLRQDTAANWISGNPTLLAGELGRESDTGKIKIGNGSSTWTALAYQAWATLPIAVNAGGTGQTTYTNGQLLIGNTTGNTLTKATLTAGAGVAITNGNGSITIASTAVTDVTATSPIASTGGSTPNISIQDGTTTQKGAVQLEDSTTSTSTTTAATPASVKAANDLADAALPKAGGTMTGDLVVPSINGGPLAGFRNAIINGSLAIAQRGTSFEAAANNDDSYNLDRWYVLSDGNDIVDITQNTATVPTNGNYAIALDVETVNKKFGIAQIIEADSCIGLIGDQVTLSFKARVSSTTNLDNVKAAIVAWSGTADTVTSDIVSAWNVEGTNPTLIANATYENTPANLNLTTSYATYSVTATVDTASTKNIVVFIWSDVTTTSLDEFLYVTDVQLEHGPVATPFERRPIGTELALCQRYYYQSTTNSTTKRRWAGSTAGSYLAHEFSFPVTMRAAPTIGTTTTPVLTNCSTLATSMITTDAVAWTVTSTVAGGVISASWAATTADAEL